MFSLPWIEFKPLVYGYANARAHALFSKLLTRQQLLELTQMPSIETFIESLHRTEYKKEILELSLNFKREDLVELALSSNFAAFCRKVYNFTPKKAKPIIQVILSKWDAHNIKMIFLAKKQKRTFEEVRPYLILAASTTEEFLKSLYLENDPEKLYLLIKKTEFGQAFLSSKLPILSKPIKEAFKSLNSDSFIFDMFLFGLDFYNFILLKDVINKFQLQKDISAFLSSYADEKNLLLVIRLANQNISSDQLKEYLVPGGTVSINRWVSAFEKKDYFAILNSVSNLLPLKSVIEDYKKFKDLAEIEAEISLAFAKKRLKVFRGANLSLAVIVAALFFKEQEIDNIRKILRGKLNNFEPVEIEKLLIFT
jgi:V/A-type H+-transporting ATPase subunit C